MLRSDASGEPMRYRGTVCLGPGGPATSTNLATSLKDEAVARLGPLRPRLLSPAAVQGQRSRVSAGVPRTVTFPLAVAGLHVLVTAAGRFTWHGPEAAAIADTAPVASYFWRRCGPVQVQVSAVWTATFSVDGLGPFPVEQTITQEGSINLRVHRAKAVLVPARPQA